MTAVLSGSNVRAAETSWWRDGHLRITVLAGVVVAAVTWWINRGIVGPNLFGDELIYAHFARELQAFDYSPVPGLGYAAKYVPPGYPGILAPFIDRGDWYANLLLVNAVVVSLSGIPVYLLARRYMPRAVALAPAIVALVYPAHWVYSQLLMSENLYAPLFFVLLLVIDNFMRRPSRQTIFLVGVAVGAAFLVRQISLGMLLGLAVVIPVLLVAHGHGSWWRRIRGSVVAALGHGLVLALAFAVTILPWIVFGIRADDLPEVMGLANSRSRKGRATWNLMLYAGYYLGYLGVVTAPVTLPMVVAVASRRRQIDWRPLWPLWATTAVAVVGLGAPALRHSFLVYTRFGKLHGRYVTYLVVLLLVTGLAVLHRALEASDDGPRKIRAIAAGVVGVVGALVAGDALVGRGFMSPTNSPEGYALLVRLGVVWAVGFAVLGWGALAVGRRLRDGWGAHAVGVVAVVAFVASSVHYLADDPRKDRRLPAHAAAVASAVEEGVIERPASVVLDVEGGKVDRVAERVGYGLQFWGLGQVPVEVGSGDLSSFGPDAVMLTPRPGADAQVVATYTIRGNTWWLVRAAPAD